MLNFSLSLLRLRNTYDEIKCDGNGETRDYRNNCSQRTKVTCSYSEFRGTIQWQKITRKCTNNKTLHNKKHVCTYRQNLKDAILHDLT